MSNYTAPSYPVIIPAPKNVTYHHRAINTTAISPCNLTIDIQTPSNFDKDSFAYVNHTIYWYLEKYIFINRMPCTNATPQADHTQFNISIATNSKLMPEDMLDTNESYTLTVDDLEVTLAAQQWSGVVRGLSTLAQLVKSTNESGIYNIGYVPLQV